MTIEYHGMASGYCYLLPLLSVCHWRHLTDINIGWLFWVVRFSFVRREK